jgi:NADH-quinone oxidoreductase subunit N
MIESITLLVVIAAALYFAESGPKLIKPVIQFFILNLIISTFYLIGVGLFLFLSPYSNDFTLTYSAIYTWLNHVGQIWDVFESLNMMLFVKLFCAFILLPLLFKLTLAPFSIWIVRVYAELPWVILLILMTIYKIVYITIFINLFIKVLDFVPSLQDFWVNTTWLFIVPSIFVGCLAYRSQDLKTILAFTTVSQISYVIGALIVGDILAQKYAMIYLILYCMQIFGFIAIFILLQSKYNFTNLNQLFLVKKYNKIHYYIMFSIIISLAGVPPFAGFFAKYFVFISIYNSGHFIIALAGLLSSFFIAIIYLQIALQLMHVKPTYNEVLFLEHSKQEGFVVEVTNDGIFITRIINYILFVIFGINLFFFILFPFI